MDVTGLVEKAATFYTQKHVKRRQVSKRVITILEPSTHSWYKGMIYTTPDSGGNYYFRTWFRRKEVLSQVSPHCNLTEAIQLGETEAIGIMSKIKTGHKYLDLVGMN